MMNELWDFLLFLFAFVLVIFPIVLIFKLHTLKTKINDLSTQLRDVDRKLAKALDSKTGPQEMPETSKQTVTPETKPIILKEEENAGKSIPEVAKEVVRPDKKVIAMALPEETKPVKTAAPARKVVKPVQPKEPSKLRSGFTKNILEPLIGGNLFSKIGIITLVLGIGFFVKYAIDQDWINEVGRVAIGVLAGGCIIGLAHRLKEKYIVFASVMAGGGIAVLYITITLAFREYMLFSQTVAFAILILITVFSVINSLLYNRQELAIFSLAGGFLSPLMVSTGSGNYIVLFSFLLILNCGMLIIALRKNWESTGIIAFLLSLAFYWTWLLSGFESQFAGATVFASLFFIQFYLLAVIKHYKELKRLTVLQAILILVNNMSLLFSCMYIFNRYDYEVQGLATLVIAAFNAVILLILFRQSRIDRNVIYLIIGIVMSLVSLAIPIQMDGHVITMFWAAEAVLLLWLWQRSKINIFKFRK